MTTKIISVPPFDIVVFGATGDLSARKLMPALYQRDRDGQLPDEGRIIAVSRRSMSTAEFRETVVAALAEHVAAREHDAAVVARFVERIDYRMVDGAGQEGWSGLADLLAAGAERVRVFYLATAPDLFGPISRRIGEYGLVTARTRVVVEKPIGKDLASSRLVNDAVGAVFSEDKIYRIDHYLGKETVQNLMALRFANALFEPIWNAAHIDHVQITVAESLGVGTRAGYYDHAGALRDMVQNHIIQLLCLVAMEPPQSLDADSVRDEKRKVLRALKPIDESNAGALTVRGQYRAGASAEGKVAGYLDELGHAVSATETFVAIKAEIANWRWAGVPFYLRTGKRLPERVSEIVVRFRPIAHSIFDKAAGTVRSNRLVLRLQPNEGVKLWIMIKDPGPGGMRLEHVPLDMSFAERFETRNPDAYERLLMDVVRGNQTLFMRRDEVEAAWTWIDPILAAWAGAKEGPRGYTAGTWGPTAAVELLARDGRAWDEEE